jgi:hypothetical protein
MKESFTTHIENGRFTHVPKGLINQFESKRIKVTIESEKNRSLKQNKYYFGVVITFCQDGILETQGERVSIEQAHSFLKYNCNYLEITNTESGEIARMEKPTKNLTTIEWEIYTEQCRRFLKEWFGIQTPLPGEQLTIE